MSQSNKIKKDVYDINLKLSNSDLVIQNFGNGSQRGKDNFTIKPSGIDLKKHNLDDMVTMDFSGNKIEGNLSPSTDEPTHRIIYSTSDFVGGVIHTHSKYATSFAQAGIPIENFGTTHSDFSKHKILVTDQLSIEEVENDYELNTGKKIVEILKENKIDFSETPGILSIRHGVFSWGKDIEEAFKNAEIIEYLAQMAYQTKNINSSSMVIEEYIANKHYERKHGLNKYYGQ